MTVTTKTIARLLISSCILILGMAAFANAEVKVHKGAQVQLDIPSGWKVQGEKDDMVLLDPNEDLIMIVRVIETGDLKKASKDADAFMNKSVQELKWGDKPQKHDLNGMKAVVVEGNAKYKGKDVEVGALIVITPAKKAMLVFGIMDHSKSATLQPQVDALLNSIKPVN
jgi:predicted Zn-dependent protease